MSNEEKEVKKDVAAEPAKADSQAIINTDAAKAKANEVAGKAKGMANDLVEKVKSDNRYIIGLVVVAVVVLLLLFGNTLRPGHMTVSSYLSAMKKFDAEKIVKLYHEDMYEDEKDAEDELEEMFDEYEDEDYRFLSFKIRECDVYSDDELDDLADTLESYYDIDPDDVQAARTYYVRVKYDEDGDKGLRYRGVTVIKIEGKWYIYG